MPATQAVNLRTLSPSARLSAEADAAKALGRGELVIAPADIDYILLANPAASDKLATLAAPAPPTWLCPGVHTLERVFPALKAIQKHVVHHLAPGPALFIVEVGEDDAPGVRSRANLPDRAADDGARFRVRILGPSVAADILDRTKTPILGATISDREGRSCRSAVEAVEAVESRGLSPAAALDSGTLGSSHPWPTEIRLDRRGGIHVEKEGAYERRFVLNQAALNILFVCTGNTCRSPMAEAIASGLLARSATGAPIKVQSAGLGASSGAVATPDAVRSVKALGFTLERHTSQPLTQRIIDEADLIFTMTRSHMAGVLALSPDAAAKTALLDPAGEDIADPIGLPAKVYTETARRLERHIALRLKELAP